MVYASDGKAFARLLEEWNIPPRVVGPAENQVVNIWLDDSGKYIAMMVGSEPTTVAIWPTRPGAREPIRTLSWDDLEQNSVAVDPTGRLVALVGQTSESPHIQTWELASPEKSAALSFSGALPSGGEEWINEAIFAPGCRWLATAAINVVGLWPIPSGVPRILEGHQWQLLDLEFTPDGRRLVSADRLGNVALWDLETGENRRLAQTGQWKMLDVDPTGRFVAIAQQGGVLIVPLDGGASRALDGFAPETWVVAVAVDAAGRLVAAAPRQGTEEDKVIRIWDLESGESWTLGPTDEGYELGEGWQEGVGDLAFLPDGSLVSVGVGGLRIWSLSERTHERVAPSRAQAKMASLGDGVSIAYTTGTNETSALMITNLKTRNTREVPSHGDLVWPIAVDASGTILVTGSGDGIVRVGPVSGELPHLLLGHERVVTAVAVSPDGKWIASGSEDRTIRLWPMPDLSRPPLHTLPHEELIAKLHSLTNVRVVDDAESSTGWKIDIDPFPGWQEVPTW
jgi:WD40 repeat protein